MQLLVLGMHRSGTSAVARLLNMMGAYFAPEDMAMPATHANPKGYWERKDICAVHDDMLAALGLSWHSLADFSTERLQDEVLLEFEPRLQRIINNLDAQRPWMAKDPRFCLFLPLWQKFLEVPVYIYVYRHPLEIAHSLQSREEKSAACADTALHPLHQAGFPPQSVRFPLSLGLALWEKYTVHSLQEADAQIPRIWVSYHELMRQPIETVNTLFQKLQSYEVQGLRLPSEKEILAHLESALHRQKHQSSETEQYTNAQQQALMKAMEAGESAVQTLNDVSVSHAAMDALKAHRDSLQTAERLVVLNAAYQKEQVEYQDLQVEHQNVQQQAQEQTQALADVEQQLHTVNHALERNKTYLDSALLALSEKNLEVQQLQASQQDSQNQQQEQTQSQHLQIEEKDQQIQALSSALEEHQQHKNQLLHYTHALEVDIESVFNSLMWRSGQIFTRLALAVTLRKPSATAQDHIQEVRQQLASVRTGANSSTPLPAQPAPSIRQALQTATHHPNDYAAWGKKYDALNASQLRSITAWLKRQKDLPLISIIMPTYNSSENYLKAAIESVRQQLYPRWELCIADDASTLPQVKKLLAAYEHRDARIKVCYRSKNGHISAASNSALEMAEGEWISFLDHDDELANTALFWVYKAIQDAPDSDFFYSDEDKITADGERHAPHFKPAWNPDLLLSYNYLNHLSVYRAQHLKEVGGLREGFEGAQDYDLALRVTERLKSEHICHIPRVLYHWRVTDTSTAGQETQKPYALLAAQKAIAEHFERCQILASVSDAPELLGAQRVTYTLPAQPPLVSIIIPTYNGLSLVKMCIESLRHKTTYPNYEILLIDNNSDDPAALLYFDELQEKGWATVIEYPQAFNYAAINNMAVEQAKGDILCLLNNDIEVISPDWLSEMVGHVLRPGIGAVGARLWYPDNTLQHAGVIIGLGGVAGHSHKYFPQGDPGYMGRTVVSQNVSAATAACLVLRKATYHQVEGMNAEHLKVAFNDVDFCLRIGEHGLRIVWTPYASLYHHESISRGHEDSPEKVARFQREMAYMKTRWSVPLSDDLAYSPNLTQDTENFAYAWPPRVTALDDALAGHVSIRHGLCAALEAQHQNPEASLPSETVHDAPATDENAMLPPYSLLQGEGVQCRPFTAPAPVAAACTLHYVDACSTQDTTKAFPEVPVEALYPIQQLCDLDTQDLPWTAQDFVICLDELPRVANPIGVVQRLFQALKPGGLLLLSVPDKRHHFNRYRSLSEFATLQQRYESGFTQVPDADYIAFLQDIHPHLPPAEQPKAVHQSRLRRESIHVWDAKHFQAFMQNTLNLLDIQAELEFTSDAQSSTDVLQLWKKY